MATTWAARLAEIFNRQATEPLLLSADGILDYATVLRRAGGMAAALCARGLKAGERLSIDLPNSTGFALLYFACLLGRFVAVPVNRALPPPDRAFILANCGSRMQVGGDGAIQVDDLGGTDIEFAAALDLLAQVRDDDLFSIHFTSGTTSRPRGVPHYVAGLFGNAASFNATYGVTSAHRFGHLMPMAYMAGFLNTLLVPVAAGGSVALLPQFDARLALDFWRPLAAHGVNALWVSPTMLATLLRADRDIRGPDYCRSSNLLLFSATAPLPLRVRQDFEQRYAVPVVESYGLSELLLITANRGAAGSPAGSVGPALHDVDLAVRDTDGTVLPPGGEGSIFVRTPYTMAGYIDYDTGRPVPLADDWFDTGDVGTVGTDGYLRVTGRHKDLIIRGGFNISPRQIEEALRLHPAVADVAVVGQPDDFYGETVAAVVVLQPDQTLAALESGLRQHCRDLVGPGAIPDRFVAIDALPVSSMGKVQKHVLRQDLAKA